MSASDSAVTSDTEDSSSTVTSSESSMPAPYSFEPSESDTEASSGTPVVQIVRILIRIDCHGMYS